MVLNLEKEIFEIEILYLYLNLERTSGNRNNRIISLFNSI